MLATEPPSLKVMAFKPYGHDEPLATPYIKHRMSVQIIMQVGYEIFIFAHTVVKTLIFFSSTNLNCFLHFTHFFRTKLNKSPFFSFSLALSPSLSALQTATILILLYAGETVFASEKVPGADEKGQYSREHYTIVYTSFVLSQLFNEFNSRKMRPHLFVFSGLHHHSLFIVMWCISFLVQVLMVQFGGSFTETEPLSVGQWFGCVAVGVLPLLWTFLLNLFPDRWTTVPWVFPWDKPVVVSSPDQDMPLDWDPASLVASRESSTDVAIVIPPAPMVKRSPSELWESALIKIAMQLRVVERFRCVKR